ncbi:UDP-glycosyltransferase 73C1-like [Prunus yedoensis var. nudiflora]|uniref:UDP-glycosyltransferase 73C1-like n=1 Tax=Prunus yedoensis var. nudiflora TaxID=2094558 RepID=A0A314ZNI0_PRUYE|nr:UDP-glycosyltransferase 73C1-like [Prunus yedoensis var. nudiflora]
MASRDEERQLHFVLFPFMAQGHMIPMMDFARLLAQRGITITIVTTPHNAARFQTAVTRARQSGLQIQLVQLRFPSEEAGLPDGCENLDMLPAIGSADKFFFATALLQQPAEKLFEELTPKPNAIFSDVCLPWTISIAQKFHIPRISFSGFCCFCLLCIHSLQTSKVLENVMSESEYFVVPDFPDRFEVTKAQLPGPLTLNMKDFYDQVEAAEKATYGIIMNTFEELEPAYIEAYKKAAKVWCIGPASLCNKDDLDKARRGNKASIDEHHCLKWLDSWEPGSVVYACLGSLCNLITDQLIELALGLEASEKPFIWVVRGCSQSEELENWISETGFEERTKARSLLIRGLPLVTWPLFADQFLNEKLVVQVLKIAVSVGVEYPVKWGEEEKIGVLVKKENVKEAIEKVMDGEERQGRIERAREFGEMAKKAVAEGGSSHLNITQLIQDIMQQGSNCRENFRK